MDKDGDSILHRAYSLVHGDRGENYGPPVEDFTRTGRMWGAILGIPDVPPEKVAMCMAALKMSRECNAPLRENRIDMAGYAETLDMVRQCQEEEARRIAEGYREIAEQGTQPKERIA